MIYILIYIFLLAIKVYTEKAVTYASYHQTIAERTQPSRAPAFGEPEFRALELLIPSR